MSKRQRERRAKRLRHAPAARAGMVASIAVGAALAAPAVGQADTYTVNSTADTTASGTLRSAISSAEAHAGADAIEFSASLSGTISLDTPLTITKPVTITDSTPDSSPVTVDGSNLTNSMLNLFMTTAGDDVTVSGLTFANGNATSGSADGGAIFNLSADLTVQSSVLSGNEAGTGGGAIFQGSSGSLVVNATTLSGNTAGGDGGAIYGRYGNVTIQNGSRLVDNHADSGSGGAVYTYGSLSVSDSTISGNSAVNGGGIHAEYTSLSVTDSTVRDNHATSSGGGITASYLSGAITRSTISGNTTNGHGGGLLLFTVPLNISNTTISDNTAAQGGGGIYNDAHSPTSHVTVESSTVARNRGGNGAGGGISVDGSAGAQPPDLQNSIVACNSTEAGSGADLAVAGGIGPITSSFSLIQNAPSSAFADSTGHDIVGQNPQLGALADNLGGKETLALAPNSPAINSGSTGTSADERLYARPGDFSGQVDMGAFEVQQGETTGPAAACDSHVTSAPPASTPTTTGGTQTTQQSSQQQTPAAQPIVGAGAPKAIKNGITIKVSCAAAPCNGSVDLTALEKLKGKKVVGLAKTKKVKVGSKSYSLAAGQTKTVTVKLNGAGKKLLAKFKKLPLKVSVMQQKAAGNRAVKTARVTLKKKR
jgi:predicted outer membrane repeat protein